MDIWGFPPGVLVCLTTEKLLEALPNPRVGGQIFENEIIISLVNSYACSRASVAIPLPLDLVSPASSLYLGHTASQARPGEPARHSDMQLESLNSRG